MSEQVTAYRDNQGRLHTTEKLAEESNQRDVDRALNSQAVSALSERFLLRNRRTIATDNLKEVYVVLKGIYDE